MSRRVIKKEPGAWNCFPSVQIMPKIKDDDLRIIY